MNSLLSFIQEVIDRFNGKKFGDYGQEWTIEDHMLEILTKIGLA